MRPPPPPPYALSLSLSPLSLFPPLSLSLCLSLPFSLSLYCNIFWMQYEATLGNPNPKHFMLTHDRQRCDHQSRAKNAKGRIMVFSCFVSRWGQIIHVSFLKHNTTRRVDSDYIVVSRTNCTTPRVVKHLK